MVAISLILGAFISIVIGRYFWWKSETKNKKVSQFSDFIEIPRDNVWSMISNPAHFEKFYPFEADSFDSNVVGVGSSFNLSSFYNSIKSKKFVVIWNPTSEFAWGNDSNNWEYRIFLKDVGEKRTDITIQIASQKEINPFSFLSSSNQKTETSEPVGYQTLLDLYHGIKIYCERGVVENKFAKTE